MLLLRNTLSKPLRPSLSPSRSQCSSLIIGLLDSRRHCRFATSASSTQDETPRHAPPRNLKLSDPAILSTPEPREHVYKLGKLVSDEELRLPVRPNPFLSTTTSTASENKTIDLPPSIFKQDVNLGVMSRVVRWQRNKAQAGTHKVLKKGEVSGTGKKPYKQKGTGKARQGSKRNPHMRGGGVVFGPTPRSHAHDMNIKERLVGLRSALCARFQEKNLVVVESLKSPEVVRTKQVSHGVQELRLTRPLIIETLDGPKVDSPGSFSRLRLAARNLHKVDILPPLGLNVLDILKHPELVVSLEALKHLEARFEKLKPKPKGAASAAPWRRKAKVDALPEERGGAVDGKEKRDSVDDAEVIPTSHGNQEKANATA